MLARHFVSFKKKKKKNSRGLFVQAASDSQALLRCLREVPLNALVSVPVKGLEFAPAFGPSVDGVVIDPGDPEDQDFTLQVDTINTLNNILLRKDVVAKLSRYSSYDLAPFPPALSLLIPSASLQILRHFEYFKQENWNWKEEAKKIENIFRNREQIERKDLLNFIAYEFQSRWKRTINENLFTILWYNWWNL